MAGLVVDIEQAKRHREMVAKMQQKEREERKKPHKGHIPWKNKRTIDGY